MTTERPPRWNDAAMDAISAIEALHALHVKYQEWYDSLPEDRQETDAVGRKLAAGETLREIVDWLYVTTREPLIARRFQDDP